MDCLNNLVKTRFLRNINNEITQARNIITNPRYMPTDIPDFFPARLTDRKKLYNRYLDYYGFKDRFCDIDVESVDDIVYHMDAGNVVLVISKYKYVITKIINETAYTTGEMCIHNGKHFIQNKLYHSAMFNMTMCITPLTTN
jgi:hypothetical protein